MNVKLKFLQGKHAVRAETYAKIIEVLVNEDLRSPSKEIIQICFKSDTSSGIVELSLKEFESLKNSISASAEVVKGFKVLKE